MVIAVASFKDADYAAMLAEVGPRCPDSADVILLESDRWDALAVPSLIACASRPARHPGNIHTPPAQRQRTRRVTPSHRNISSTTATWCERSRRTRSSRCPSTTAGMVIAQATSHGRPWHPGAGLDLWPRWCRRAMHQLCRRADDVHRRAGACRTHRLRTGQSGGRRRVPGRGDAR